ncbi:IclR family transcriptional regulator [Noviherbaspirillum cavernae]|uniref:IclR family transcriptional regulator n=1 Tax=Noviherbaspirillum cavernae TaxID=2320862 RepID=A0A418X2Y5_9BURK|nr:IclR family transcriptional regulator [Noviherbaspirillum cavernae]RJG06785.1 IclR family transcriptional regulator [Noviherbaspirillum cavernae]
MKVNKKKNVIETPSPVPRAATARSGTQSIERAAQLLRLVAAHQRDGVRLTQLADLAQLDVSTTYRILKCLVEEGLIEQRMPDKAYALGLLSFEIGLAAMQRSPLLERAIPAMKAIAAETGDTVYLVVRSGDEAVCLHREEGSFPIKALMLEVGGRRALGVGAGGLHLLSSLADDEIEQVCARNRAAIAQFRGLSIAELRDMVRDTRERGYGVSRDRLTEGVSGIGVAIPNPDGTPYAAISVAAISSRLHPERYAEVVKVIQHAIARFLTER